MEKDLTLLIMAAGMGSRFGGPKQLYPVGPNGEFIMDYSIYSAKKGSANEIVFVLFLIIPFFNKRERYTE